MSRNYLALTHDTLHETEILTDEEFGRLVRGLLLFSSTGEDPELTGNERFVYPILKGQEERYQNSYEETKEKRRSGGNKGGRPSKNQDHIPQEQEANKEPVTEKLNLDCERDIAQEHDMISDEFTPSVDEGGNKSEKKENTEEHVSADIVSMLKKKYYEENKKEKSSKVPSLNEIEKYAKKQGYEKEIAMQFKEYYDARGWAIDGKPIRRWENVIDAWARNRPFSAKKQERIEHETSFNLTEFFNLAKNRTFFGRIESDRGIFDTRTTGRKLAAVCC